MTPSMRHDDETDSQKYLLTGSRLETEKMNKTLKNTSLVTFLLVFQQMKGKFLTFACWRVTKNGRSPVAGIK